MGLASATLLLDNPRVDSLEPIAVEALADSGALFLCIPDHIANQLQLKETSKKEITTADGRRQLCPYVGPIHVRFGNRECYVGAVVLGDEVLFGAVPMEDLDLGYYPLRAPRGCKSAKPQFRCRHRKRVVLPGRE